MNKILKAVSLSWLAVTCAVAIGCATSPSEPTSSDEPAEAETSAAVTTNCAAFCRAEGGPGFFETGATTQAACTNQRGQWFQSAGCCCKCVTINACL
jgi:hypothetical protein